MSAPGGGFKRFRPRKNLIEYMVPAAQSDWIGWEAGLVQRARGGDVRAFERLYRDHIGSVYGLCLRMTRDPAAAEDCAQEAFFNAWKSLGRFETRSSFGTWLHRIAVNAVLNRRRKRAAQAELPPLPADAGKEHGDAPEEWTLDTPVEVHEIEAAVGDLTQHHLGRHRPQRPARQRRNGRDRDGERRSEDRDVRSRGVLVRGEDLERRYQRLLRSAVG